MYTYDSVLKNSRNKNVRTLCYTILVNLIIFTFLINIREPSWLCFVSGLSTHYLILCSIFWNTVIAVDVWRVFAEGVRWQRLQDAANKNLEKYGVWGGVRGRKRDSIDHNFFLTLIFLFSENLQFFFNFYVRLKL